MKKLNDHHWAILDTVVIGALVVAAAALLSWTINNWNQVWPNLLLAGFACCAGYLVYLVFDWRLDHNSRKSSKRSRK